MHRKNLFLPRQSVGRKRSADLHFLSPIIWFGVQMEGSRSRLPQYSRDELFSTNIAFPGIRPWGMIGHKLMVALVITRRRDCRHRLGVRSYGKYGASRLLV